jgi:DNA-binding transcriptional ArsR family regulator
MDRRIELFFENRVCDQSASWTKYCYIISSNATTTPSREGKIGELDGKIKKRDIISILADTNEATMEKIQELSEMFKALSDPTRLSLVKLLSDHEGALCVNALARELDVTQSAVSQHLRVLRQTGLVKGERRGSSVHYAIDQNRLERYKTQILETLGENFIVTR